jgi:predicted  nucleic acid-binding Zn-ribbon protein
MWPKALAQLLELLPHIARLLPSADRYMQTRAAADTQTSNTLKQMSDDLRSELRRVTTSHESLLRQLDEQNQRLAVITEQADAARAAAEAAEERTSGLERRLAISNAMLTVMLPLVIVLVVLTILLLVRH